MGPLKGKFGVLREPNYRRLFAGRTISLVGDGIAPVAIAFAVLDLTGSATDLGIVLAAHSLLITALVLVGGVWADRVSPRLAMLRADLVRMVVVGAIAALLITGVAEIWQLALLYAIEGALVAGLTLSVAQVLYETTTAERVPQASLSRVLAYDWFGSLALEPVGLALIGPLAAGVGISTTLWICAGVTLICQAAVIAVPAVHKLESRSGAPAPLPLRPIKPGD
jgi:MFS-type transporter involved in bile tolerance (Atg22 family)